MIILIKENIEKHAATEERAAALEAKGFKRIIEEKPETDYSEMTKDQLIECARERGIAVNPRDKKADILAAL